MRKTIHIHLGPHKTGSTAIQKALAKHRSIIAEKCGVYYISGSLISNINRSLKRNNPALLERAIEDLALACDKSSSDCVISSEDFAGELPGRAGQKKPYPDLLTNMNTFKEVFSDFNCKFYFFVRERNEWLKSAYFQHIRYRCKFSSFRDYSAFIHSDSLWEKVLEEAKLQNGADLVILSYREDSNFSAVDTFFEKCLGTANLTEIPIKNERINTSPNKEIIAIMEQINSSGASPRAKRHAKNTLFNRPKTISLSPKEMKLPLWGGPPERPGWLSNELENLWTRVEKRVTHQKQPNLLPNEASDLTKLKFRLVEASKDFPSKGRGEMENQKRILEYRFRGLPQTCLLLGLVISYLRRNTKHTEQAALMFQRLWEEEYEILLGTLPTRWLISSFQTFLDHGISENQRIAGSAAFYFANLIKAYEAERAIEGLPANARYPNIKPNTKNGFSGLDRFPLGGTDLLLNTNGLLLELAARSDRVGRVIQEFLVRTKLANTIFSRMDDNRIHYEVDIPNFSNCWSFFEEP